MAESSKPYLSALQKIHKVRLDEMLSFGPESAPDRNKETNDRVRKLLKKVQEISQRIDRLASRI